MTQKVFCLQLTEANHDDNEFYTLGGAGFLSEAERQQSIDRIKASINLAGHDCQDPDVRRCYLVDVLDPEDQFTQTDNIEVDEETALRLLGVGDFDAARERERELLSAEVALAVSR